MQPFVCGRRTSLAFVYFVIGATLWSPLFVSPQQSSASASSQASEIQPAPVPEHPLLYWRGITFNGFASAAYTYNANRPPSHTNQFRTFDFDANELKLDMAELVVQRAVSNPEDFGFRVDLTGGESEPEIAASYGLFRNKCTGEGRHIDIHQLFASYIVPLGKGVRLDAGKFITHFGYEVIEGYDGYNDTYSHSFLFGYGIPFTHTGLKASYPLASKLTATVMVVRGWDDVHDNNRSLSFGGQVAIAPTKSTTTYLNYMVGAESPGNNHSLRSTYNVVQTWAAAPALAFAADFLVAHEDDLLGPGKSAMWTAFAGYARYSFTNRFSLALRGEVFHDRDGVRTGQTQTLTGFTLTPEYMLKINLGRLPTRFALRGDLRYDHSNISTFETRDQRSRKQLTVAADLIYAF